MFKRLGLFTVLGLLLVAVVLPASAASVVYSYEGLELNHWSSDGVTTQSVEIFAYKLQEGGDEPPTAAFAEFYLDILCQVGGTTYFDIDQYVTVNEDYDLLEVSEDLGWAGLSNVVSVYNNATGSWVSVTINLNQYAYSSPYFDDGLNKRNSTGHAGSIDLPGSECDINVTQGTTWGYNYKTPYYS